MKVNLNLCGWNTRTTFEKGEDPVWEPGGLHAPESTSGWLGDGEVESKKREREEEEEEIACYSLGRLVVPTRLA
jgi:hypothetical protein